MRPPPEGGKVLGLAHGIMPGTASMRPPPKRGKCLARTAYPNRWRGAIVSQT